MIFYFSGTGNSRYAAERLASFTKDELISINDRMKMKNAGEVPDDFSFGSEKPFVFVMPTYAWNLPPVVTEWIEENHFHGSSSAYFIMTCGEDNGSSAAFARHLCDKKNFIYMGCRKVVMPENYIVMYDAPSEEDAEKIVGESEGKLRKIAEYILARKPMGSDKRTAGANFKSTAVNRAFFAMTVKDKKFYTTDKCTGCGTCVKVCPLDNICLANGKPEWLGDCTHCMACICSCPTEAIEYGKATAGRRRYRCPD